MRTVIAFVGPAFVVAALAASAAGHMQTKRTVFHRYAPFAGPRVATDVKVARTVSGTCSAPSGTDRRSDAYLCVARNLVYDPCFAATKARLNYVLCPLYTPESKVLRINLTLPLPSNPTIARRGDDPWAIRTAGGTWCKLYTGQTYRVLGMPVSYLCSAGYILREPRRGATWTALFAPGYKAVDRPPGSYHRVRLAAAWR